MIELKFTGETLEDVLNQMAVLFPREPEQPAPTPEQPVQAQEPAPQPAPAPRKRAKPAVVPNVNPDPDPGEVGAALAAQETDGEPTDVDPDVVRGQFARFAAADYDRAAAMLDSIGCGTFGEAAAAGMLGKLAELMAA